MADRGPKPKKGDTESLYVTLPKRMHSYLGYLAQQSFLGASENDVAAHILARELERMLNNGFHRIDIPKPD